MSSSEEVHRSIKLETSQIFSEPPLHHPVAAAVAADPGEDENNGILIPQEAPPPSNTAINAGPGRFNPSGVAGTS